ncbi:TetR family transcriptional regulator [Streptomyces corchorusii]|uniref:TetR family transcriptional regulator n=2 Tax=Streptomyces TaxID=1883 RepID=A0A101PVK4_STRCK|nr:TetR/AcrR family transcriptional regulator C-terminal domain-containing protein [Streptomyces corchorusii]KUN18487.1 TetR family transcriptional regulator [Streptomyces corchorusii]
MVVRREGYIRAALELLDEVGLNGLTLRRLGDRLGVQGPALYAHFRSKQELLDQMAEAMLDDELARLDEAEYDEWSAWLSERARVIRRALLSYRDGARLHAGSRPTDGSAMLPLIKPLVAAGFSEQDAVQAVLSVSRYTLGCAIDEQQRPPEETTEHGEDPEASFEFGLRALIGGLRRAAENPTDGTRGP